MNKQTLDKSRGGMYTAKPYISWWLAGFGVAALLVVMLMFFRGTKSAETADVAAAVDNAQFVRTPDLVLTTLDGRQLSLRELEGQAVVINFWASWCPPCRAEMPSLQSYYQQNQDKGVLVVAINAGESQAQVEQFVNEFGLTLDIVLDPNMQVMAEFDVGSLPTSIFIDRDGNIRGRHMGLIERHQIESQMVPLM
jgi:thiol-disulfide isomerase/thioredoxin